MAKAAACALQNPNAPNAASISHTSPVTWLS
jgi:hypothetical protein